MQVQNQANNSDKRFLDELAKLFERHYKQQLSEVIKRGIKSKKLQKKL